MTKEALKQFYNKYRLYIIPLVIGVSSLILIIFVIYPQTIKLISNNSAQGALVNRSKFLEAKASELKSVNEADLSKKLNLALTALPGDKDFGEVIGLVQEIANQNRFDLISLDLTSSEEQATSSTSFGYYNITVEAVGPKGGLNNLLVEIENASRVMRVDTILITSGKDPNIINAITGVKVYYSVIPTKIGSVDAPLPQLSRQDEDLLLKLSSIIEAAPPTSTTLSPRGKSNPFE